MSIEIMEYTTKPISVMAVKLTPENVVATAEWCGGRAMRAEALLLQVRGSKGLVWRQVRIGELIVKNDLGFFVYDEATFLRDHNLKSPVLTVS